MPQFNESDINEAKRRVWEMRNRASHFVDDSQEVPPKKNEKKQPEPPKKPEQAGADQENEDLPRDKSFFVILAMIMLLSKEGADNTLILALLYLLL